ncbi:unnamed protein product [Bursaphelenchus xylophilus]|uniref:(pine wood nematode) hypothetical protein n=1 Tax=Bursaphelenchus xylophilus TaxID=6326 RepID=A0A7I8XHQ2_BURXY|nr:unnamed protein product [Bursaphelenchus xylophilus]CAG9084683.1 unnamed protein product [Bursaphelenchus xylophilus]
MGKSLLEGCIRALVHHPEVVDYSQRLGLLEHIRQVLHYDEESFELLVKQEETSIEYLLDIEIQTCGGADQIEFMLQLDRCDEGSCATSNMILKSNKQISITLRHGQKSVLKINKSHSMFKKWFEKNNVVLVVKTKHLDVDKETRFKINGINDAILKCKLKRDYENGERLELADLSCVLSMLSKSLKSEILFETTVAVLKIVCDFYKIEWSTCELLLVDRLLHLELDDKETNDYNYKMNHVEDYKEGRPKLMDDVAKNLVKRVDNYLSTLGDSAFFSLDFNFSDISRILRFFKPIVKVLNYLNHPNVIEVLSKKLKAKVEVAVSKVVSSLEVSNVAELSEIVDKLHMDMKKCNVIYSKLFRSFDLCYLQIVSENVEEKVFQLTDRQLSKALRALDSRNGQQLKEFTEGTMQLFDSLRQLSNFMKQETGILNLGGFEKYFYNACVFWTHGWRGIHIGFIKKCVEDSRDLEDQLPENPFQINDYKKHNVDIHESAILCLAFCKAFCDDVVCLDIQDDGMALLCYIQAISILADSVVIYSTKIHQQTLNCRLTYFELAEAANGIEHACDHLISNFERFLNLKNLITRLNPEEKDQIIGSVQKLLRVTERRCKDLSSDLIKNICVYKYDALRKQCEQIASPQRKIMRNGDQVDSLLNTVERLRNCLKGTLLPRLYYVAVDLLWKEIIHTFENYLIDGQNNGYYDIIYRSCEAVADLLSVDWKREKTDFLRSTLFMNRTPTVDLILQYCANLGDITLNTLIKENTPYATLKMGYVQTTNRYILLSLEIVSASNLPVLDTLSKSSDPYLRVELYPRCLFNLQDHPPCTTATRYKTLNPVWTESCQFLLREDLFFLHGASLCISILDQDVFSHNDLGGQAFYPLAAIPRLQTSENLKIFRIPLILPVKKQYNHQFQVRFCKDTEWAALNSLHVNISINTERILPKF